MLTHDKEEIHELFGNFRAEWLRDDIYRLFSEPTYFSHLLNNTSCVLMGGRGTGKTTALRCLSYEGQDALGKQDWNSPDYVGVYYKINTNVVTAFVGSELTIDEWTRLFGHFLNLTICGELTSYLNWYSEKIIDCDFSRVDFRSVGFSLGLRETCDLTQLDDAIARATTELELYINNLGTERPTISQFQSPIKSFIRQLKNVPGHESTTLHIILDEYENLLDYQQKLVNTLIKHGGDDCYFKIGVRELGWRVRVTLNEIETLISPADYELIRIEERLSENFSDFARGVCESRLNRNSIDQNRPYRLDNMLPAMSTIDEAEKLGVKRKVAKLRDDLRAEFPSDRTFDEIHDFALFIFYNLNRENLEQTMLDLRGFVTRESNAVHRYENHAHAMLFAIADKGAQVSKHYCGHQTFARIANTNIRFYMQLVHECVVQQTTVEKSLSEPVDWESQTVAARKVGLSYLRELEGVTARGGQLSKLILGFGRYFQILAANPVGGSPECNQFHIRDSEGDSTIEAREESHKLLTEAIMHIALVRSPGTKLATESDTHSWDYSPHPIFAPYFNYSTRRKRKISISDNDLVAMSKFPQPTIRKLLGNRRQHLADDELPVQMSIFDEFFG